MVLNVLKKMKTRIYAAPAVEGLRSANESRQQGAALEQQMRAASRGAALEQHLLIDTITVHFSKIINKGTE